MRNSWVAALVVAGGLFCGVLQGEEVATAPVGADPLLWVPGSPELELHEKVDEGKYQARKRTVLGNVRREGLDSPNRPDAGLEISDLKGSMQGAAAGMKFLDLVVSLNGGPEVPTQGAFSRLVRAPVGYTITVTTAGKETRDLSFAPGKLGVSTRGYIDAMRYYWHKCPHNPVWDEDVLLAGRRYEAEPALGRAALMKARQAGWDDPLYEVMLSVMRAREGKYEEAMAIGIPVMKRVPVELQQVLAGVLINCAQMSYHWEIADQIGKDYPEAVNISDLAEDRFAELKRVREGMGNLGTNSRRPSEVLAEQGVEELTASVVDGQVPVNVWGVNAEVGPLVVKEGGKMEMKAATDMGGMWTFEPMIQDGEVSVDISERDHDKMGLKWYGKSCGLELSDGAVENGPSVIVVELNTAGWVEVVLRDFDDREKALRLMCPHQFVGPAGGKHHMRLAVVGQRVEAFVDEVKVFDGLFRPAWGTRKLRAGIFASGVDAEMSGLKWGRIKGAAGK